MASSFLYALSNGFAPPQRVQFCKLNPFRRVLNPYFWTGLKPVRQYWEQVANLLPQKETIFYALS